MTILGTKKYWIGSSDQTTCQQDEQILKNSGYINIQLHSAHYKSNSNFWQRTFGGSNTIVLSTNVKYKTSIEDIDSTSIQDIKNIDINKTYNLGLQRNIAIKIPAHADALELTIRITGTRNDKLQAKFQMLNRPEFQTALQMTPTIIGQVITITALAKQLFTETEASTQLEANYAGIISSQPDVNPVGNGKLTKGYLILISSDDDHSFQNVDDSNFSLRGEKRETLYYKDVQVTNTNIVFLVSYEKVKGVDEKSGWFLKYQEALNKLDEIYIAENDKIESILNNAKNIWIQGNTLLDADSTYLNTEKTTIKTAMMSEILKKYENLTSKLIPVQKEEISIDTEVLKQISGSATLEEISIALPSTSSYLNKTFNLLKNKPYDDKGQPIIAVKASKALSLLNKDKKIYLDDLKSEGKSFSLFDSST